MNDEELKEKIMEEAWDLVDEEDISISEALKRTWKKYKKKEDDND